MHGGSHCSVSPRRRAPGTWRSSLSIALGLGCALAVSACEEAPVTEIFVCYQIDPSLGVVRSPLRVVALTGDGTLDGGVLRLEDPDQSQLRDIRGGDVTAGWTRGDGSASNRLHFTLGAVLSTLPGAPADFVQEADVPFVTDHIVSVRISLDAACRSIACGAGLTCVAGTCRPVRIERACMPDYGTAAPAACDERTRVACPSP